MKTHNNSKRSRAGFTLIELLAVIMIISILAVALLPNIRGAFDSAKVTACKANLSTIYSGLLEYKAKYNRLPRHSGVRFFGSLVRDEVFEASDVKRLTCPGVEVGVLFQSVEQLPPKEWFTRDNFEIVDGGWSTYAGRDFDNYPLKKFPGSGSEPLIADDNDGGMNHNTTTVILWANGSVSTYELVILKDDGVIDPEETTLIVGPDSPIEALQKLSLD